MAMLSEIVKGQKILITDIPGVLNTSQSMYNQTSFDEEAVMQLKRIVDATGCVVVLSPNKEHTETSIPCAIANLLAILLHTQVYSIIGISAVLKHLGECQPASFCVLRYHDGVKREWLGTFGNRFIYSGTKEEETDNNGRCRITFKAGLTGDIARGAILMLDNKIETSDIPLKVFNAVERGVYRIKELAQEIRSDPKQRTNETLEKLYEIWIEQNMRPDSSVFFSLKYLLTIRYSENGKVFDWAIETLRKVAEKHGIEFNPKIFLD